MCQFEHFCIKVANSGGRELFRACAGKFQAAKKRCSIRSGGRDDRPSLIRREKYRRVTLILDVVCERLEAPRAGIADVTAI
jgi:hypothetical protein